MFRCALTTLGCKVNQCETQALAEMMKKNGYTIVDFDELAEVYIINTCCVTAEGERKSRQLVRRAVAKNPSAVIAVTGCAAQKAPELFYGIPGVSIVAGNTQKQNLPAMILSDLKGCSVEDMTYFSAYQELPDSLGEKTRAFIKIQDGCNNFCSYCIVPYTRGRERSREPESILGELADLKIKGFKEVTLLGQNVNSYRYERPDGTVVDFPALLALVAQSAEGMRVRFTTSHPKDMSDETLRIIAAYPNVCRHIHLPVQSGSNRILKLMNRKYTREWYLDRIAAIRRILPDCGITTDMFSGFHSETDADFEETLDLMREVGFDSSFLFKYSERPGTYASKHLPDDIPEEMKIARLQRMIDLQNELSLESNRKDIGKEFEVLVEGFSKRSREQLFGRTSQNKVVVFDKGSHRIGEFVRVKVNDASSATLLGEALE